MVKEENGNEKEREASTDDKTLLPGLHATCLRTLAKAMQNRMWKIEFAKQLSVGLICPAWERTEG